MLEKITFAVNDFHIGSEASQIGEDRQKVLNITQERIAQAKLSLSSPVYDLVQELVLSNIAFFFQGLSWKCSVLFKWRKTWNL